MRTWLTLAEAVLCAAANGHHVEPSVLKAAAWRGEIIGKSRRPKPAEAWRYYSADSVKAYAIRNVDSAKQKHFRASPVSLDMGFAGEREGISKAQRRAQVAVLRQTEQQRIDTIPYLVGIRANRGS